MVLSEMTAAERAEFNRCLRAWQRGARCAEHGVTSHEDQRCLEYFHFVNSRLRSLAPVYTILRRIEMLEAQIVAGIDGREEAFAELAMLRGTEVAA